MAFAAASMAEGQGVTQALWNVDKALDGLLARLNMPSFQLYLTGDNNFRYTIYPEYKANRPKERPEYLKDVKQHLVNSYGAVVSDGCEADDLCGIDQCTSDDETFIVAIDKDLDMIPGKRYSPAIMRNGQIVKDEREYYITPTDAIQFFYHQLLIGDPTDNVKGAAGIGKVKAKRILEGLTDERELFEAVQPLFSCDEELLLNAQLLWIWREPEGIWKFPE